MRSIEVMGEASKQLPDALKANYKKFPWKEITGMRDKLIYAYFGMDPETIWQTVKENISLSDELNDLFVAVSLQSHTLKK